MHNEKNQHDSGNNYRDNVAIVNEILKLPRTDTKNRPHCALEAAERALQLSRNAQYVMGEAYGLLSYGEYYLLNGLYRSPLEESMDIRKNFEQALELFELEEDEQGRMLAHLGLAAFHLSMDQLEEAEEQLAGASELSALNPGDHLYDCVFVDVSNKRGLINIKKGLFRKAESFLGVAYEFCCGKELWAKAAELKLNLAEIWLIQSVEHDPIQTYEDAARLALLEGECGLAAKCFSALAELLFREKKYDEFKRYEDLYVVNAQLAAEKEAKHEMVLIKNFWEKENERLIRNTGRNLEEKIVERNQKLEEVNRRLSMISAIGQRLTASLKPSEVYRTLYVELKALMDVDGFFIVEYDEEEQTATQKEVMKMGTPIETGDSWLCDKDSLIQSCINSQTTILCDDLNQESWDESSGLREVFGGEFESAIFVPLKVKERKLGLICVMSADNAAYNEQHIKILESISIYVSIAVENASIYRKLNFVSKQVQELANHDSLTGLANRRLLYELIPKVYANAQRTDTKVAVLYMDLDSFKAVNDNFGHQVGDEVLKIFTERVLGIIRSLDIFARVGGDEFVVIMTNLKVKFNAAILARKIIREASRPMVIQDVEHQIGVSVGISIYPDDSTETDELLVLADEAMYEIKKKAKNSYNFFNEN